MARELDQDELVEHWTLIGDDLDRVADERGGRGRGREQLAQPPCTPRGTATLVPRQVVGFEVSGVGHVSDEQ